MKSTPACWTTGPLYQRPTGPLDQRANGPLDHRATGPLDQRANGPLDHSQVWSTPVCWTTGPGFLILAAPSQLYLCQEAGPPGTTRLYSSTGLFSVYSGVPAYPGLGLCIHNSRPEILGGDRPGKYLYLGGHPAPLTYCQWIVAIRSKYKLVPPEKYLYGS